MLTAMIIAILKFTLFAPFVVAFWLFNKNSGEASLLAAEYSHKRAVVEAMIGYRAKYEGNTGDFTDEFKREYTKFFDKTFEEINRNPADKLREMNDKDSFSLEQTDKFLKTVLGPIERIASLFKK